MTWGGSPPWYRVGSGVRDRVAERVFRGDGFFWEGLGRFQEMYLLSVFVVCISRALRGRGEARAQSYLSWIVCEGAMLNGLEYCW